MNGRGMPVNPENPADARISEIDIEIFDLQHKIEELAYQRRLLSGGKLTDVPEGMKPVRFTLRCNHNHHCSEVQEMVIPTLDGVLPSGFQMPKWTCERHRDMVAVSREGTQA